MKKPKKRIVNAKVPVARSKLHLEPTPRELRFLEYVSRCIDADGCQPSYRELMGQFQWGSPNSVRSIVRNLESKGIVYGTGTRGIKYAWRKYL